MTQWLYIILAWGSATLYDHGHFVAAAFVLGLCLGLFWPLLWRRLNEVHAAADADSSPVKAEEK